VGKVLYFSLQTFFLLNFHTHQFVVDRSVVGNKNDGIGLKAELN
jgi:hypothetical protein